MTTDLKDKTQSFTLPADWKDFLRSVAEQEEITISEFCRRGLLREFERAGYDVSQLSEPNSPGKPGHR